MQNKKCPKCKKQVSPDTKFCTRCGTQLDDIHVSSCDNEIKEIMIRWLIFGAIIVAASVICLSYINKNKKSDVENQSETEVIENKEPMKGETMDIASEENIKMISEQPLSEEVKKLQEEVPFVPQNFFEDEGEWWLCEINEIYNFDLENEKGFNYDENINLYRNHKYEWAKDMDANMQEWTYKYNPTTYVITFYVDISGYIMSYSYKVYNLGAGFVKFEDTSGNRMLLYGTEEEFNGDGTWVSLVHEIQDPNVRFYEFGEEIGQVKEHYYYMNEEMQDSDRTEMASYDYSEDTSILNVERIYGMSTLHSTFKLEAFNNAILAREEYCLSSNGHSEYQYRDYIMFRPLNSGDYVISQMIESL